MADEWDKQEEDEQGDGKDANLRVIVIGAGAAGLAAVSTLRVREYAAYKFEYVAND